MDEHESARVAFGFTVRQFFVYNLNIGVVMSCVCPRLRIGLATVLCGLLLVAAACRGSQLPAALSDQEFWSLTETFSEPPGTFNLSDNFVSNEPRFADNVRRLAPSGGVYLGVGPEQNFSYIAKLRPALAFVVDIRRENRNLHLLYKALFELSADRADFVSRLFSRRRPADLESSATVREIFDRYDRVDRSPDQYTDNANLVRERLLARGLPLSASDFDSIDRAFKAFYTDGPAIQFWGSRTVGADTVRPSYRQLMTALDMTGQSRSYLSTEEGFRFVRGLHSKNLIVPLVGDFSGPMTLRRVGDFVRRRRDVITAFYGSNVGVYLTNQQTAAFCRNLSALPVAPRAWFIESDGIRPLAAKLKACPAETH